jgi:transcriptional regulator with XRE-family HTH domain
LEVTPQPLQPYIAAVVRTHRHAYGWSQEELALKMGVDPSEISKLESGKRQSTTWTLQRVAQALNITCAQLFWTAEALQLRVEREEAKMKE